MIVWVNGPFGAGKTTLAGKLQVLRPDILVFDPEEIGYVVKTIVPRSASGDYQDLPLWRGLTLAALAEIRRHYRQTVLVPMTVVHPDHQAELLEGAKRIDPDLLHIFLNPREDILRERILRQTMHADPVRNADIVQWRLAQVERCIASSRTLPAGTLVLDSGNRTVDALAACVLALIS